MRRFAPTLICLLFVAMRSGSLTARVPRKPSGNKPPTPNALELHAPAGERPTKIDPAGETVLPNGRLITPRGTQVRVAPHPYGLAVSPDGKTIVTANSGTSPFSVSIITGLESSTPQVAQIPPGAKPAKGELDSVYMGVAIAPDNRTLYVSEGDNGSVGIFDLVTRERLASLSLDGDFEGRKYEHSLTGELKLSRDGRTLYVLDLAHFRLVVVDTQSKQTVASVGVGRLPFALALSPDGRRAYVSNVGMFQYALVPGVPVATGGASGMRPNQATSNPKAGLEFPAFGFPSQQAEQGSVVQGKQIPGLGDPNVPESDSVWMVDVSHPKAPRVTAKVRTGLPVGDQSFGGSSPGGVVAGRREVFVANTSQDSITIIDASSSRVKKAVLLEPTASVRGLRGVLPFGLALSPDEKRLYVACAGINAIAVVDAGDGKVLGYIPTGWFPARVAISADGKTLYVANAKGFGAGPNGGPNFHRRPEGTYIGDITKGTVSIIAVPDEHRLEAGTLEVLRNNGFVPMSAYDEGASGSFLASFNRKPAMFGCHRRWLLPRICIDPAPPPPPPEVSCIHYIVYIVKENRTFDQVFGDLAEVGGVKPEADPELVEYGEDVTVANKETGQSVEHARVTPNHHALARRFGISDNYYVDSDVSVDGHHWLQGNTPNELLEASWPASYGDKFAFVADPDAPGRLDIGGAAPRPETYTQAGPLWVHLARHHINFRNYGEGLDVPGNEDGPGLEPTGLREILNTPLPEPLFENTSRSYPAFNTDISDQYRFQQFREEFQLRYASGKEPLPPFICIWLPNDHTGKPRPSEGYPFHASYVADNDLALGKLVELFSHSPFWKDMAIFVTEDDAQDGTDHVDAHRSPLLVISPYSRRGVWHTHTSMESILKTFDLILGLPALNQYDASATDLSECFTDQPDFTPYEALPSDTRVFDPAKVVESGLDLKAQRRRSEPLDDPATIRREMQEREEQKEDRER